MTAPPRAARPCRPPVPPARAARPCRPPVPPAPCRETLRGMSAESAWPAGHDERAGLAALSAVPAEAVREALLGCCSSPRWAESVLAGRPYASVADLLRRSATATAELGIADLTDALAGHPRIGEQPGGDRQAGGGDDGDRAHWSRAEQAGLSQADAATRQALADGNRAYEQRFGHIYLVCATGRSAGQLLQLLRQRLASDPGTEWHVLRTELAKINEIRLRKLIGGAS